MMDKTGDFRIEDGILQFYLGRSRDLVIPEGVTGIGCGAFARYKGFQSVTLPESVTKIGDGAFRDCIRLTSVNIPESVTEIGDDAFNGCSKLENIRVPDGVTRIGASAFNHCKALAGKHGFIVVKGIVFGYYGRKPVTVVPEDAVKIGKDAFANCGRLRGLVIPESVTGIGPRAFSGCMNLADLTIPEHLAPSAGSFLPEEYVLNSAGCVIHTPDVSRLPARYRPYAATPGTRVSPKTDLLICNGTPGSHDKNRWLAEELGIEIVSEDEFLRRALECDPDPYRTVNGKQVQRLEYRNLL